MKSGGLGWVDASDGNVLWHGNSNTNSKRDNALAVDSIVCDGVCKPEVGDRRGEFRDKKKKSGMEMASYSHRTLNFQARLGLENIKTLHRWWSVGSLWHETFAQSLDPRQSEPAPRHMTESACSQGLNSEG